jgi:hypothetical protein
MKVSRSIFKDSNRQVDWHSCRELGDVAGEKNEGRAYLLAGKKGSELCAERAAKPVSEWEPLLFLKATSTARAVGSDEE